MSEPTVLVDDLVFPEGTRWHEGRLWFSDIHTGRVIAVEPGGAVEVMLEMHDDYPSGLGFLPDGSFVVAAIRTKQIRRVHKGRSSLLADLSAYPGDFINDMVTDGEGRTYVGTRPSVRVAAERGADTVVLVRPDGSSEIAARGVTGPNGMVLTPAGTLIVAETHAFALTEFERGADGRLGDRQTFADLSDRGLRPDGISFDETGCVWAGVGHGGAAARIRRGGEILEQVAPLEGHWVLACVLGGADRRTLYMATVRTTLEGVGELDGPGSRAHDDHDRWVRSQSAGWIEQARVDVAGAGTP